MPAGHKQENAEIPTGKAVLEPNAPKEHTACPENGRDIIKDKLEPPLTGQNDGATDKIQMASN